MGRYCFRGSNIVPANHRCSVTTVGLPGYTPLFKYGQGYGFRAIPASFPFVPPGRGGVPLGYSRKARFWQVIESTADLVAKRISVCQVAREMVQTLTTEGRQTNKQIKRDYRKHGRMSIMAAQSRRHHFRLWSVHQSSRRGLSPWHYLPAPASYTYIVLKNGDLGRSNLLQWPRFVLGNHCDRAGAG